jgi:ABC-type multidrug transport system ATPase subunit
VDRICDHVVIMHKGKLQFFGTIEDLRRGGPVDQSALAVYDLEVKMGVEEAAFAAALERAGCGVERKPPRRMIVKLPEGGDSMLLFREAKAAGAQIRHLEPNRASLEEAFLRVVSASDQEPA